MEIRKARPGDEIEIAGVHVESWETTYRGIFPDEILDNHSVEFRERQWGEAIERDSESIFVAENKNNEIIGFVMGGPNRSDYKEFEGELYAIYLVQEEQGQGVGRSLTQTLVRNFVDAGITSMMLGVAKGNQAEKFYEALGGKRLGSEDVEFRGHLIPHIYYGWDEIGAILEET